MNGKFIISLDFELFWGVRDHRTIEGYGENILGVHEVIPRLLKNFKEHKVKGTFAIVGLLFFDDKRDLYENTPSNLPSYDNKSLSPYLGYLDNVGEDADTDRYHYAPNLIKQILNHSEHEIGTHTFSHYYCLEKGQNIDNFRTDLEKALSISKSKYNAKLTSIVFPRNQFNDDYLKVCQEQGIICFRGNEHSWIYAARNRKDESRFRRLLRLLDAYVNITGTNCYSDEYLKSKYLVNIPSSRFLRPYSSKLFFFEWLRLRRIKSGMTYAARNNMTYHLWWHPHNFGTNQDQNFKFLAKILDHYNELNFKYNFQSCTMSELANQILNEK